MLVRWCLIFLTLTLFITPVAADPPATSSKPAATVPPSTPSDTDEEYELQRLLVDTLDQVERNYVEGISRRELVEAAIDGILRKLDPYSSYITPDELDRFRGNIESEFGGIGIQITMDRGRLEVLSPLVDSPAYRAGILSGDRITEIDGRSTDGVNLDTVTKWLKGPPGSVVELTVVHPMKTEPQKVTITREKIHLETILGYRRNDNDQWDFVLDPDKRIGYVCITVFSRDTAAELAKVLKSLDDRNIDKLILDLRFNAGGLLRSAVEVSDLFVDQGRIVSTKGRNVPEHVWNAHAENTFARFRMAVLVNRFSASASEIVAACLQDHHRAVIIGERTWGKGSVQNVIPLEHGSSALKLTTASYYRPSGKNIHRLPNATEKDEWGVKPDEGYQVKLTASDTVALLISRQQRDIIKPPHATNQATAENQEEKPSTDDKTAKNSSASAPEPKPENPKPKTPADRVLQKAFEYLETVPR